MAPFHWNDHDGDGDGEDTFAAQSLRRWREDEPVDPMVRREAPFDWYRTPSESHPRVETAAQLPDLDPDIALWPVTPLSRWPFAGAPSVGVWPKGWVGVDNTGTIYVCTVGGAPGTWVAQGGGGGGSITLIESTDASVDVSGGAGPTVDLSVPGGASNTMPISNPTGPPTTGTETPDPVSGADTAKWVQFPSDASVMAWGLEGDLFPRWTFSADPGSFGITMGDGTFDPVGVGGGASLQASTSADRGTVPFLFGGPGPFTGPVLGQGQFTVSSVDPTGTIGGFSGDAVLTPRGLWLCTSAGNPSTAVWTLMLSPGAPIVRKFPFAFDTPDILTGAALYTPTVDDILIDAWIEIDTAWDGTTPFGDFGTFGGGAGNLGFLRGLSNFAVDMTQADDATDPGAGFLWGVGWSRMGDNGVLGGITDSVGHGVLFETDAIASVPQAATPLVTNGTNSSNSHLGQRSIGKFTAANPVQVVVSQDGTNTGADPGSTQGAAILYLVTATPA